MSTLAWGYSEEKQPFILFRTYGVEANDSDRHQKVVGYLKVVRKLGRINRQCFHFHYVNDRGELNGNSLRLPGEIQEIIRCGSIIINDIPRGCEYSFRVLFDW